MADARDYHLTIELTPHFMSAAALRKHISYHRWREIKSNLINEHGLVCKICSTVVADRKNLDADEVFVFPTDGTVLMERIQLLCKKCHQVKDFAQTERLIGNGTLRSPNLRKILVDWFCHVNKCTEANFDAHYEDARKTVRAVEKRYGPHIDQAHINYGPYQSYFLRAKDPERFNTHTAASHAVGDIIRNGIVHEDYREDLLEIVKSDPQFAEELLHLVKAGDFKSTRTILMQELEDRFGDDSAKTDDEPIFGRKASD